MFRSEEDFKDWLKNPYHSVEEREFLIKLNVDFINDVKSPKVLAYRTTQLKHKKYENGMMYQFKLEKVMDYGPNIAGAFASYDPEEANKLRNEIYEVVEWVRTGRQMGSTTMSGGRRTPNYAEGSAAVEPQIVSENGNNPSEGRKSAFDFGSI